MSNFKYFASFFILLVGFNLSLFFSSLVFAQQKCSTENIMQGICGYFKKNSHLEYLTSSDGGKIENPLYQPPVNPDAQSVTTLRSNDSNNETMNRLADLTVEYELKTEEVMSSSALKSLPARSQRYVQKAFQNIQMQSMHPGADPASNRVTLPKDLNDANSAVKDYSTAEFKELMNKLAPGVFEKVSEFNSEYQIKSKAIFPQGGYQMGYGAAPEQPAIKQYSEQEKERLRKRAQTAFDFAKKSVIQTLKKGLPDDKLTEEQKKLVDRVEKIQMTDSFSKEVSESPSCVESNHSNAFYSITNHSVNVCLSYLEQPMPNLIGTLGHEIGHSVDPCRCTHNMFSYETNSSEKESLLSQSNETFFLNNQQYTAKSLAVSRSRGISLIQTGIEIEKHPLYSVQECFVRTARFSDIDKEDIKYAEKGVKDAYQRSGQKTPDPDQMREISENLKNNKYCQGLLFKKSELTEAMSDFYGVSATSHWLEQNRLRTAEDIIGLNELNNFCYLEGTLALGAPSLSNSQKVHPIHMLRTKTLLQYPGIAEALGCTTLQDKFGCYEKFRTGKEQVNSGYAPIKDLLTAISSSGDVSSSNTSRSKSSTQSKPRPSGGQK